MAGKITQSQARRYRAEANRLKDQLRRMFRTWGQEYPDGRVIGSIRVSDETIARVQVAGLLNHAVVVTHYGDTLHFHAMPSPAEVES